MSAAQERSPERDLESALGTPEHNAKISKSYPVNPRI
jgi:hypothetical protein